MSKVNSEAIVAFFKENPNPPDALFHKFHEEKGYDHGEAETETYKMVTKYVQFLTKGKSVKEKVTEKDVDKDELAAGVKVELEHTDDLETAKRIALDHLAEFSMYYTALDKMEKGLKKKASLKLPAIDDHTTPTIIATVTPKMESGASKLQPFARVAKFINARSKTNFVRRLLFGEVRDKLVEGVNINKTAGLEKIAFMAFMDELEKMGGIPTPAKAASEFKMLMSKTPLEAKMRLGMNKIDVKGMIASGNRISAINAVNTQANQSLFGGKVRPRVSINPISFPFQNTASGRYKAPGGAVPTTRFETKEYPTYTSSVVAHV